MEKQQTMRMTEFIKFTKNIHKLPNNRYLVELNSGEFVFYKEVNKNKWKKNK